MNEHPSFLRGRIASLPAGVANLSAVLKDIGKIATPDEIAQLRQIKRRYEDVGKQIDAHSYDEARKSAEATAAAYRENPTPENFAKLREMETDPEKVKEHFRQLVKNLKQVRKDIAAEALPLLTAIYERLRARADKELEKVKETEAKLAESYGLPAEPGLVSAAVQNLIVQLDGQSPNQFQPFAPIFGALKI